MPCNCPLPSTFHFLKGSFWHFFPYKIFSVGVGIFLKDVGFKKKATWHEFYSLLCALFVGVRVSGYIVHGAVEGTWALRQTRVWIPPLQLPAVEHGQIIDRLRSIFHKKSIIIQDCWKGWIKWKWQTANCLPVSLPFLSPLKIIQSLELWLSTWPSSYRLHS